MSCHKKHEDKNKHHCKPPRKKHHCHGHKPWDPPVRRDRDHDRDHCRKR